MLRPFFEHRRGLFVSVDGPAGAGKSTIVAHLAQMLTADGEHVHATAEPFAGPMINRGLDRERLDSCHSPRLGRKPSWADTMR